MSLPLNNNLLLEQLRLTLSDLNAQILVIKNQLKRQLEVMPYPEQMTIWDITDSDGKYPLAELLVAKASVLSSIADVQSVMRRK